MRNKRFRRYYAGTSDMFRLFAPLSRYMYRNHSSFSGVEISYDFDNAQQSSSMTDAHNSIWTFLEIIEDADY